jgi:ABC-type multidrug transport system ATPase subunit
MSHEQNDETGSTGRTDADAPGETPVREADATRSADSETDAESTGEADTESTGEADTESTGEADTETTDTRRSADATRVDGVDRVLTVEDVDHAYGEVSVLDDVSFSVASGSVTALVGPNGSGKTTLLRVVAGLMRPTAGSLSVGVDVDRPIGYLPQNPDFRPVFTVRETLEFYADLLSADVDVDAAIENVGLTAAADRRVDALSGGMRRLLGIAQATLGDPPVVLLDEPTGDLDPRMTEYIFEVIDGLSGGGTAILLATHNVTGAERADDVLLLDRGSIVAEGPPDELTAEAGAETLKEAFLALVSGEGELTVRTGTAGEGSA